MFTFFMEKQTIKPKAKRVTIMIADDLDKKIRNKQAKLIQSESRSVSYSSVINSALRGKFKV